MSPEAFEEFRRVVLGDPDLQARLREPAELAGFIAAVVQAGAERGLVFTGQEVEAAMRTARRAWIERWI